MRFFILSICCCFFLISNAQDTVDGRIIAGIDGTPLPYVNVGVIGKGIGTVSDRDGRFTLVIGDRYDKDTIRVSMIGYKAQEYLVSEFKSLVSKNYNINLEESTNLIEEIAIVDSRMKSKIIGNKSTNRNFSVGLGSDTLGNEVAIKIKTRRKMTIVQTFNLSINSNTYDTLRFRLNFYESKRGKPGKAINQESIIITTDIEDDVLTVDLSQYNIVQKKDFFVSIEWIEDLGEGELNFSGAFPAREAFYRGTSQAKWNSIKGLGIGMNVKVLQ